MKKTILGTIIAFAALALVIMPASAACTGCCWFTGGGQIHSDSLDKVSFGGNAMTMKDFDIRGEWEFVDHEGNLFHGQVDHIECLYNSNLPGPEMPPAEDNVIKFGGTGVYNHQPGYTFEIRAVDGGEPGVDDSFTIKIWDPFDVLIEDIHGFISGNFQIHPSNNGHPCVGEEE